MGHGDERIMELLSRKQIWLSDAGGTAGGGISIIETTEAVVHVRFDNLYTSCSYTVRVKLV